MRASILHRSRCASATLAAIAAVLAACGGATEYAMVGTPRVDSVHGTLEVEADADGSGSRVEVVLDELPPPGTVGESYSSYVAWAQPEDGAPVRVGVITYEGSARRGELSGAAPFRSFTFLVTAEASEAPDGPSELVVAERRVTAED